MHRFFISLLLVVSVVSVFGQLPFVGDKIKKVEKIPYKYEYPSNPLVGNDSEVDKAWVVYSDRNNNVVYSDKTFSKPTGKVQFLDSFYVASISGDAFELIKYTPANIKSVNKVAEPDKVEYVGWVDKSRLVLNSNSLVHPTSKLPYKFVTMLNGNRIFDNYKKFANGRKVKTYTDPDLVNEVDKNLNLDDIVYVYKQSSDKILIGKNSNFNTGNALANIIGWTSVSIVQSFGTRLFVEPVSTGERDTSHVYLFPQLEHALNAKTNTPIGIYMKESGCEYSEQLWTRSPVFDITFHKKDNVISSKVIQTGLVLNPFDRKEAFIYNVNGSKINYSKLCDLIDNSQNTNIVFALNMSNDTKEYLAVLLQTLQEFEGYFNSKFTGQSVKFGYLNCADPANGTPTLYNKYSDIMHPIINIVKESVSKNKPAPTSGNLNGLTGAVNYFKNREKETNVVVLISTQGDEAFSDAAYKTKFAKVTEDLAKSNARVVFFQPYSGSGINYASFVVQAKNVLEKSSEKTAQIKREFQVGNSTESAYTNTFSSMETGATNIFCLDFPKNSNSQGFIVFPTIGNKTDGKYLNKALDSLFYQIDLDNNNTIKSISEVFNSPGIFNNKTSKNFEKYYRFYEGIPNDMEMQTRNVNFNYFAKGYTISPANANRYYRHSLLLTGDEFEEIYQLFKSLKFDLLVQNTTQTSKTNTYNAMVKALNIASTKTGSQLNRNISLANFFYETCGYYSNNPVLYKFNMQHLVSGMTISKDEFAQMIDELNKLTTKFYTLNNNSKYIFTSNGKKYYWVHEEYLP